MRHGIHRVWPLASLADGNAMHWAAMAFADLPEVFSRAEALAAGVTVGQLRARVARGDVKRVRQGFYARSREPMQRLDAYRRLTVVAASAFSSGHAVSHLSAAMLHGLWLPMGPLGPAHVTAIEANQRSRDADDVKVHHCDSTLTHLAEVDGIRVTSVARTLADCLRTFGPRLAVPIADCALGRRLVTVEEIEAELRSQVRWIGRPRALRSLTLVDGRRESWLESWSAVWLHERELPAMEPQVSVFSSGGTFLGRVDGIWLAAGVVGEVDGRGKYNGTYGESEAPGSADVGAARAGGEGSESTGALYREKLREDDIRDTGLGVVRWGLTHLLDRPNETVARIQGRLGQSRWDGFRGHLELSDPTGLTKVSKLPPDGPWGRHIRRSGPVRRGAAK